MNGESVHSPPITKTPVWLDCDPGHDDAFAIILAGHNESIDLLGISTVAGNQTVQKTTINALTVLAISGLEHVDVVAGQTVPLMRPSIICPEIHGDSGLECSKGFPIVKIKDPIHKKAIMHMFDVINSHESKVTLIATACLTNVALLLTVFPEVKEKLEKIVLLGGAVGSGNISPVAEFNILIDPEAAKIVFESSVHIVMVPLEVSHTALVTPQILEKVKGLSSTYGDLMEDLLLYFAKSYFEVFKFEHPPLHDPLAVAYVIAPHLFKTTFMRVDIETQSLLCAGQTVCDIYHMSPKPKNVHVATHVDIAAFWALQLDAIFKGNEKSCLNSKTPA
eukprot:TRINITY_DN1776_c0_g1_i2.p1 TRINITY_DN1776_c0_g1~~TRINITY_DN1776_c0_g1_i2.p1  ORF type:complete len:335 (-),score=44.09 TRINITY_DN1776_c0_g1_i2:73-1077(-)